MNTITSAITDDITFRVKIIMLYKLGVEEWQLKDDADFVSDLGIDSLDVMELQIELEKEFKITIPSEEAEKLTTVGALIRHIIQASSF